MQGRSRKRAVRGHGVQRPPAPRAASSGWTATVAPGAGPPSGPYTRHGVKRAPLVWKDTKSSGHRRPRAVSEEATQELVALAARPEIAGGGGPAHGGVRAAQPSRRPPSRRRARSIPRACRASRRCRAHSTAPTASRERARPVAGDAVLDERAHQPAPLAIVLGGESTTGPPRRGSTGVGLGSKREALPPRRRARGRAA